MNRGDIAAHFGIPRTTVYGLTCRADFPAPLREDPYPEWSFTAVEAFINRYLESRSADGPPRPYLVGVRITRAERNWLTTHYGKPSAGVRQLLEAAVRNTA